MIAYFDTSSVVPLLINEPSTDACNRLWNAAEKVVAVPLLYPEARAAVARAQRMGRITEPQLVVAVAELDLLFDEVEQIEITTALARRAGVLAQVHSLRGYDAVHLAGATMAPDPELVFATADRDLAKAAAASGLAVATTFP